MKEYIAYLLRKPSPGREFYSLQISTYGDTEDDAIENAKKTAVSLNFPEDSLSDWVCDHIEEL